LHGYETESEAGKLAATIDLDNLKGERHHLYYLLCEEKKEHGIRPNKRHAYTMSMADIIVRYKKSQGYTVYFQTGSDDHGEKIEKKAASLGITPQQLVDKNVLLFQQL
ncbi:15317_t:CDS:2, partial [Funneliformis geosporum]